MIIRCTLPQFITMRLTCGHWTHTDIRELAMCFALLGTGHTRVPWPCYECSPVAAAVGHPTRRHVLQVIWPHKKPMT